MELNLRATKPRIDYIIHYLEECKLKVSYVVPNSVVRYDKNGVGTHWLKVSGSKNNPAAKHIVNALINYTSDLIDNLDDARRLSKYISKGL